MIYFAKDITRPIDATNRGGLALAFRASDDGTVALVMPDGRFVSQQPDGSLHFDAQSIGPWEKAMINGQLVTFWSGQWPAVYGWTNTPR